METRSRRTACLHAGRTSFKFIAGSGASLDEESRKRPSLDSCAQPLPAGRRMLVAPYAFDQPDKTARLKRLGVAQVIARTKYSASRAAKQLGDMLGNAAYSARAQEIARMIAREDGVQSACDAIEDYPKIIA